MNKVHIRRFLFARLQKFPDKTGIKCRRFLKISDFLEKVRKRSSRAIGVIKHFSGGGPSSANSFLQSSRADKDKMPIRNHEKSRKKTKNHLKSDLFQLKSPPKNRLETRIGWRVPKFWNSKNPNFAQKPLFCSKTVLRGSKLSKNSPTEEDRFRLLKNKNPKNPVFAQNPPFWEKNVLQGGREAWRGGVFGYF